MQYLVDKIFSYKRKKQIFNKDVLFVWIPKTAGNSVVDYLSSYNFERNADVDRLKSGFFFTKGFNTFGHIDVKSLVREKIISDTYIQNVYKFSIVRNPYDRLVSLYEYHKKINFFEGTFESYLMKIMESEIDWGLYNRKGFSQCAGQYDLLDDLNLNFIGRFENLLIDLNKLSMEINFINKNRELKHLNSSRSDNSYRHYYSSKLKKMTYRIYEKDLDFFKYNF